MSLSWTQATLEEAIKAHVEDHGEDFDDQVDNLIKTGEESCLRDLPLSIFDAREDVSITQGSQTATKPTGTVVMLELSYLSGGNRVVLLPRTTSFLQAWCKNTAEADPKYFADDYSSTEVYIAPSPNLTVTASALITKRPASITAGQATWLGTNAADLLFAACMVAAERFNMGLAESKDWAAEYGRLLASCRIEFRHLLRRSYATLAPQPMAAGKGER